MATLITGEGCRPEAINFVAQQFHAVASLQNHPLSALLGQDPPDEGEILDQMVDQGITPAEITLGVALVAAMQARDAEVARQKQAKLADPTAWD